MYKIDKKRALYILNKEYENTIFILAKGEGSKMTFSQTLATINNRNVDARPSDVMLVKDIQRGVNYVLNLLDADVMEFNKNNLFSINMLAARNSNFDNLGGFRKGTIKIGGAKHTGTNPFQIEFEFDNLKSWYEKEDQNNGLKYIELALKLFKYQFFGDGNKRTAQLMMNGLLVKNGYAPFVVDFLNEKIADELVEYYDNDNIIPLFKTMLEAQKQTMLSYCYPNEENVKIEEEFKRDLKIIENI